MIAFQTHESIREIPKADWNRLLGEEGVPYLRWEFLEALEATGCVKPEVGWAPAYLSVSKQDVIQGVAPAFVKGNSEGEFVFDHSWANFAEQRLGVDYYPKLIVACPFTPATGPRLLVQKGEHETELFRGLCAGIAEFLKGSELSSAHVLFPRSDQAEEFGGVGFAMRHGIQFHWQNAGYQHFDDFLSRYNSKRRNQIRRERRELSRQGIELQVLTGKDITPEIVDHAYAFYLSTVRKYFWGRQYLNRAFFEEICSRMPEQILIVLAFEKSGRHCLGGAFNLLGGRRLFGRYWGAHDDIKYLHFNVCYYQGIEECIRRGLEVFEPGAGGEHKIARGFEPTCTYSAHLLKHPVLNAAVRDFLQRERTAVEEQLAEHRSVLAPREPGQV